MNRQRKHLYEPYIKYHKEQWALKGLARKQYERKHIPELEKVRCEYAETQKPYAKAVNDLAHVEVLQHNRRELQRMMENEEHRQAHLAKSRCI